MVLVDPVSISIVQPHVGLHTTGKASLYPEIKSLLLPFHVPGVCDDTTMGPVFINEPANRIDFSNASGAVVECTARGNPTPEIIWIRSDGTAVGDVPGLRQVLANGNLVFPPFRAEDYRQEVHAQVYICLAKNSVGSILSRDVNVRAVVNQIYRCGVSEEYVIRGNSAVLKCSIPSFVSDFVSVESWLDDHGNTYRLSNDGSYVISQFYRSSVYEEYVIRGNSAILKCVVPSFVSDFVSVVSWHDDYNNTYSFSYGSDSYVVEQVYQSEVNNEYVIRGNSAVMKCSIPSFVSDFVTVVSWQDESGNVFPNDPKHEIYVVNQYYEAEVVSEYVIRGNTAVLKCNIPSFMADFVRVDAWLSTDGVAYKPTTDYGILALCLLQLQVTFIPLVNQLYEAGILDEYVIRGNTAILKCNVPSFVADFVHVEAWVDSEGVVYKPALGKNDDYVVSQYYVTEAENEYVIKGNSAIMKCKIPSFIADFVHVLSWLSVEDVVSQPYEAEADNEYVIRGNSAVMKCEIPSFVADFVSVVNWLDSSGGVYFPNNSDYVVHQSYEARVIDEFVLRGNSATLKCLIPSFIADFVQVIEWVSDDRTTYSPEMSENSYVVNQYYEAQVYDVFVIKGNAAVFKCNLPSFVSDHLEIISWQDTQGNTYSASSDYGVPNAKNESQWVQKVRRFLQIYKVVHSNAELVKGLEFFVKLKRILSHHLVSPDTDALGPAMSQRLDPITKIRFLQVGKILTNFSSQFFV
ncbi:hypothetical protein AAG570_006380 [Ranatra chinensis]|uniref:Ig-like domain-containing protein n=1 Tax=Ranatra chinensis TaxID=642074 RepID=A0ABD0YTW2_9HEMI